jgi:hypothetical protein
MARQILFLKTTILFCCAFFCFTGDALPVAPDRETVGWLIERDEATKLETSLPNWIVQPMTGPTRDEQRTHRVNEPPESAVHQVAKWYNHIFLKEYNPFKTNAEVLAMAKWGSCDFRPQDERDDMLLTRHSKNGLVIYTADTRLYSLVGIRFERQFATNDVNRLRDEVAACIREVFVTNILWKDSTTYHQWKKGFAACGTWASLDGYDFEGNAVAASHVYFYAFDSRIVYRIDKAHAERSAVGPYAPRFR